MTLALWRRAILLVASSVTVSHRACGSARPEEVETPCLSPSRPHRPQRTIRGVVYATGIVTPAPGAELMVVAPEAARIADLPHAGGDRVRRGDVLVRFEIPGAAAELEKQQAGGHPCRCRSR